MARYMKNNCEQGFVTNQTEIEHLKINNLRHTVLGCMLGDFDDEGNYVVDPEIVKELLIMPKYIIDSVDNIDVCVSQLKLDKQLVFFVSFEGESVSLTLAEKINYQANYKINSGLFCDINEYLLDKVETSGVIDRNVIYQRWNISQYSGNALDVFNMDEETLSQYFGIVNRFKYLMKANQILLQKENQMEEIEANYAVEMLRVLSSYPELKKCVEEKIKEVTTKQKGILRLDKPFFAKTVNEIISQTVEDNLNILTDDQRQEFEKDREKATQEYNLKVAQVLETDKRLQRGENQEVTATVRVVETKGEETRQEISSVASEYLEQVNETSRQVVARAVAEQLDGKARERYITDQKVQTSQNRQSLLEELSKITGQTYQQFAKNSTDEATQERVAEQISVVAIDTTKTLVAQIVERKQEIVAKSSPQKVVAKKPASKSASSNPKKATSKVSSSPKKTDGAKNTAKQTKTATFGYYYYSETSSVDKGYTRGEIYEQLGQSLQSWEQENLSKQLAGELTTNKGLPSTAVSKDGKRVASTPQAIKNQTSISDATQEVVAEQMDKTI